MFPLIIMAACGAAGAVASAVTTHAVHEKDRQAAKRYEKVNTELINSRDKLQQRYYKLADRSKQQIKDLNLKLAESEMEKDLVYLALSLYHELMALRENIDINPSFEVLVEFHKAILLTNYVLKQLNKHLVPVTQDYFKRTLTRIDSRDNLSKEQLFSFMSVLMNPQEDTVSSLLGEVQNKMFSQPTRELEEQDASFGKGIAIEPDEKTLGRIEVRASGCYVLFDEEQYWSEQGQKLFDSNQYEQALSCYEKAIMINSDIGNYWFYHSQALFYLDRPWRNSIQKALEIEPDNDEYLFCKGKFLLIEEYFAEGLQSINQAIEIEPNKGEYWYWRGKGLLDYGNKIVALEFLEKAVSIEADNDEYRKLRDKVKRKCLFG